MSEANVVESRDIEFIDASAPFSSFDFVEKTFGNHLPIRRLFSQARVGSVRTIVSERIPAAGVIAEENDEIRSLYGDFEMTDLRRLTFWSEPAASKSDLEKIDPGKCLGFAILKLDVVPSVRRNRWHVFEAVMRSPRYENIYITAAKGVVVRCGDRVLEVPGVLYCQQNALNKACAQVALRSLCAIHADAAAISYKRINTLAATVSGRFDPSQGLEVKQIRAVLDGFGIRYTDIDFSTMSKGEADGLEYQKFLYAGIESGAGAMLGFKLMGPNATGHHIIPFFGHTFNQDTWVPKAEAAYFHVGEETRYMPSESWLSTFIGHDDNFGSNYCVPRQYITAEQAHYVVSLYKENVRYSGVEAEAIAVNLLYSVRKNITPGDVPWLRRALRAIDLQEVVLRTISLTREQYIKHLQALEDWNFAKESVAVTNSLAALLPDHLWLVELSLAELFPANLRKIGEILLNSAVDVVPGAEASLCILARLPSCYIVQAGIDPDGTPRFTVGPSSIQAHTPLYSTRG